MKFNCVYGTRKNFGLGSPNNQYATRITPKNDGIEIYYSFPNRPNGVSSKLSSKIAALSLSLDREEALQLATAIMASLHHPTNSGLPVKWTRIGAMRPQPRTAWGEKLIAEPHSWQLAICFDNQTEMQIGRVNMDLTFEDGTATQFVVSVERNLDLPPTAKIEIDVEDAIPTRHRNDGKCRLISVSINKLTGAFNNS